MTLGGALKIASKINNPGGGRVSYVSVGGMIIPYAGVGGVIAHTKVEAFPFESNNSWRGGWYYEVGVVIPLTPQKQLGTGTVQNIDQAATELYLAYKHLDTGEQTLSGGARANLEFDLFLAGVRTRF